MKNLTSKAVRSPKSLETARLERAIPSCDLQKVARVCKWSTLHAWSCFKFNKAVCLQIIQCDMKTLNAEAFAHSNLDHWALGLGY